ncbi:hypothetical protein AVHY2522_22930 [Acidovorax sp. SUPP2522]|uniref:hypothetical protein n=1 Tax=unclassified Acidovorax TaxID=2684926 RepID=UPI00234A6FF2|nr:MULTISPECIES: hypothetical protein [unclassified Acidovorax]WCM95718.1 hypothetical protein M5C96_14645 [Acidovorax sp. GBBC 1281]GKT19560.1 hypothetical protein AVHY2522_22930 [Acidovorax sp. SUPP2522]
MTVKPSKIYDFVVPANGPFLLTVAGDYFKILASTGALNVKADWGELSGLIAGQGLEDSPFQRLYFTDVSGGSNTVKLFIGDEKFIDGMSGTFNIGTGSVQVTATVQPLAVLSNLQKTVTSASTQLLAAKAGRKYLLVQNRDGAATVYLSFGAAATVAAGVRIVPGGAFELVGTCTDQAIFAIGDVASQSNVVTVEG